MTTRRHAGTARWKTVAAVDCDRWACATYRVNFPGVEVLEARVGDVLDRLPGCDVLLGGPPCQAFSTAGRGMGEDDVRNAWPEMIAAVDELRPRMFLAENVPGMLSGRHREYTAEVLGDLERLGYRVEMRLLNAAHFGVPQLRRRLWWWGIREDVKARHLWPAPTHQWPAAALSEALGMADPESVTVVSLFCGGGLGDLGWHGRFWEAGRDGMDGMDGDGAKDGMVDEGRGGLR